MAKSWLALGKIENWALSFNLGGTWGLKPSQIGLWESLEPGDRVFFYVTLPISGIIGKGTISTKFKQDKPIWPDEIKENAVIWPLRFQFVVDSLFAQADWEVKRAVVKDLGLALRSGFQRLDDKTVNEITKRLGLSLNEAVPVETTALKSAAETQGGSVHNKIRDMLVEMGRMQGFSADKEYPMDNYRLDAVWRRIYTGVPTYVFEVQVGGSVEQAMGKLKHAYDKWNSNIFIALADKDEQKAHTLLSGTFHEIRNQIKIIKLEDIYELYRQKMAFKEKEKLLGLN